MKKLRLINARRGWRPARWTTRRAGRSRATAGLIALRLQWRRLGVERLNAPVDLGPAPRACRGLARMGSRR